jgi:hypothetical protein
MLRRNLISRALFVLTGFVLLSTPSLPSAHAALSQAPPGTPRLLLISRIGVRAPVEAVALSQPTDFHVPHKWGDVAWYDRGPKPGDQGRANIYGHLDSTCCPAVFYHLKDLKPGDTAQVVYGNGQVLTFKVVWQNVYPNAHLPMKFMFATTKERGLILITCTGVFHRDGTGYDHKRLVYARLVS